MHATSQMALLVVILVASILTVCVDASTSTAAPVTCSSLPPPCKATQYCMQAGAALVCRSCNEACDGCVGFGNNRCKTCQPGFRNTSGICQACPADTFGSECSGQCHCLLGPSDCNQVTGDCISFQCAQGWGDVPHCQTACSNTTFGSDCLNVCHCRPEDTCDPKNGLCYPSGLCANGWSGPGCQDELPQLGSAPTTENVVCANVTVLWEGWQRTVDRGNHDAVIAQYEVQSSYKLADGNDTDWIRAAIVPHDESRTVYSMTLVNLVPDSSYRFRVDVRQKDGDKLVASIMAGRVSDYAEIVCTVPTTTVSTTAIPGTTARPPGDHLIDAREFVVMFYNESAVLEVRWAMFSNVTSFVLNVTLQYYASMIGNCQPITSPTVTVVQVPTNGSYNITQLLPWRMYIVKVAAESVAHNVTDFIVRDITTNEKAPVGTVPNVTVNEITISGALVTWSELPCADRGGVLLHYRVSIYQTGSSLPLVLNVTTSSTSYRITSLQPYTRYGVTVVYVSASGESDQPGNMNTFTTFESVPGAPLVLSLTSDMTSVSATIQPPNVTNGDLEEYSLTVSENENFTASVSKSQRIDLGTTLVMTNLSPETLYYAKVRASTSVGWGTYSPTYNITTQQTAPRPPANVTIDPAARNETCVALAWAPPEGATNGEITGYNVTYKEAGTGQHKTQSVSTNTTSTLICDLKPGRYYDFDIFVFNSMGISVPLKVQLSTEQAEPPAPPIPEILNTSATAIAVALDPVIIPSVTLQYGYILFIDEVLNRSKRAVSSSNTTCPNSTEVPGNIVRNFTMNEIPTRTRFIIGDGKTYGIYVNKPLTNTHSYDIYYVLISYFQGTCKYNYVTVPNVTAEVVTVSPQPQPVPIGTEDSSNNTLLIVVIIIIVVLVIVAIIIVIICCWLRNRANQKYEPYFNDKDDYDLKVLYRVDDYNPQKYWNTIYSLRESRYIVAGNDYLRENRIFMNGQAGVVTAGLPITFQEEFENLPHGRLSTCDAAKLRQNELKNRFSHLLPYDHSRVILDPDVSSQDNYINANFIRGYKHQRAYIAAQSPFDEDTVLDFWRMIYQYEVGVVVMLSNIVEDNIVKCTQYWPDGGRRVMIGQIVLDNVETEIYSDYCMRTIRIKAKTDKEWQVVRIFDLLYWPDHGVPDDTIPLLEMRRKVNVYHQGHSTPIVVHCGTGVSRSGVYIAIDALLGQYEAEGRISAFSYVRKMRKDRPAMVRTVKQYIFIYEAIFETMVAGDTLAVGFDLRDMYHLLTQKNPTNTHSYLHGQFKCLQDFTRKLFPSMCTSALVPANVTKNRFSEIVPPDEYRAVLKTPGGVGRTDYINAVFLDSHRNCDHFILTQTPLHTTVIDFWKMVYDYEVQTIVMMESMSYDDDTCAQYWPEDHMKQYEPFFVETTDVYQQENITIRNLRLICMSNPNDVRLIRQFQFNAWADTEFIPKSKSMLLDVMDLVHDWQTVTNNDEFPIVVHCKDGATHSGLYTAVSVLCEKYLEEGEVDVFHTVKHLKRRRMQIVDILDQYRFCYKALWDFINMRTPNGTLTPQMSKTRADRPYNSLNLTSYGSEEHMPY